MPRSPTFRIALGAWVGLASLFAGAVLVGAGEADPENDGPHLRYQRSYEAAMLEAEVRGVPIFFSRHKDF